MSEGIDRLEQVVVDGSGLQMAPVTLDQVELGAVGGVPDQGDPVRAVGQETLHLLRVVDRTVVQEQEDVTARIPAKQHLEESDEVSAAFALGDEDVQPTGPGVQTAEDGDPLVLPRRVDDRLFAAQRPDPGQAGIEMEFAFVLIDEGVSVRSDGTFFIAALRARRARLTSAGSCLCLRLSLGRLCR